MGKAVGSIPTAGTKKGFMKRIATFKDITEYFQEHSHVVSNKVLLPILEKLGPPRSAFEFVGYPVNHLEFSDELSSGVELRFSKKRRVVVRLDKNNPTGVFVDFINDYGMTQNSFYRFTSLYNGDQVVTIPEWFRMIEYFPNWNI